MGTGRARRELRSLVANVVSATLVLATAMSFGLGEHEPVKAALFGVLALLWGSSAVRRFRVLAARIEQAESRAAEPRA